MRKIKNRNDFTFDPIQKISNSSTNSTKIINKINQLVPCEIIIVDPINIYLMYNHFDACLIDTIAQNDPKTVDYTGLASKFLFFGMDQK